MDKPSTPQKLQAHEKGAVYVTICLTQVLVAVLYTMFG
ncbi:hypothetical protein SAMN06269173_11317 [Hymenobacter mucosus]|uniref:Uncharacterized protein n=1 Tax=Hymenobacter mucosus TaxID=1411120 RepID=A0A239AKD7_9BACT|nr:hypothetical protein SAMN06269173_11317 [Hymenobacter mucosus]